LALKFVSFFDSEVASVLPRWKKDENYDTAPVVALLGHPLRSPEECIVEMAGSIASFGLAKKVCFSLILLVVVVVVQMGCDGQHLHCAFFFFFFSRALGGARLYAYFTCCLPTDSPTERLTDRLIGRRND
jgi:hypothetical protein